MIKTLQRRRRENKTDYGKRVKLLKSGKPRLVFRKTNKYVVVQYVESEAAKDKVIFSVSSKSLMENGWPKEAEGSLKSIPACYLTGFAVGNKIQKDKLEIPIVDFGMMRTLHKSKPFAFLKGLIDSGIKISCKKEAFPEDERIKGESLKNKIKVEEIKSKIGGKE